MISDEFNLCVMTDAGRQFVITSHEPGCQGFRERDIDGIIGG
jgi:hypothetical protein